MVSRFAPRLWNSNLVSRHRIRLFHLVSKAGALKRFPFTLLLVAGLFLPAVAIDRNAFTITRYQLEVQVGPQLARDGRHGKLTLRNDSQLPQKVLALQVSSSLNGMRIGRWTTSLLQWLGDNYTSDIDHTGSLSEAIVTSAERDCARCVDHGRRCNTVARSRPMRRA